MRGSESDRRPTTRPPDGRALAGRARLTRVQDAYRRFAVRASARTYEVIYGASWGAAGRGAGRMSGGETVIAPGSIRRRLPP